MAETGSITVETIYTRLDRFGIDYRVADSVRYQSGGDTVVTSGQSHARVRAGYPAAFQRYLYEPAYQTVHLNETT